MILTFWKGEELQKMATELENEVLKAGLKIDTKETLLISHQNTKTEIALDNSKILSHYLSWLRKSFRKSRLGTEPQEVFSMEKFLVLETNL